MRRVIYTTNAVESVQRQLRKITKNKAVFPTDESLVKMLFIAVRDGPKNGPSLNSNFLKNYTSFELSMVLFLVFDSKRL